MDLTLQPLKNQRDLGLDTLRGKLIGQSSTRGKGPLWGKQKLLPDSDTADLKKHSRGSSRPSFRRTCLKGGGPGEGGSKVRTKGNVLKKG